MFLDVVSQRAYYTFIVLVFSYIFVLTNSRFIIFEDPDAVNITETQSEVSPLINSTDDELNVLIHSNTSISSEVVPSMIPNDIIEMILKNANAIKNQQETNEVH